MKEINGIWWPEVDNHCYKVVPGQVKDVDKAIRLCNSTDTVVQAGGNVGLWAKYLAKTFGEVWTFEPDLDNFCCLKKNVTEQNVNAIHAGLGGIAGFGASEMFEPENAGAIRVTCGAEFPILTIDDLKLDSLDLLVLDTEGSEPMILAGAEKTINRCAPVLMIEDKGLSEHYGAPKGWTEAIEDYVVADRVHRDVILVPEF